MRDQAAIGTRKPRRRQLLRTMLGDALRRTRLEQGRTLADVARHARVSVPYLSELERGLKEASSEVLAAICDALLIELADLLAEVGRELIDDRAQHTQVIRLGSVLDRGDRDGLSVRDGSTLDRGMPREHGSGDVLCRLAA